MEIYRETPTEREEIFELSYPVMRCDVCMKPFKRAGKWLKAINGSPAYCAAHIEYPIV